MFRYAETRIQRWIDQGKGALLIYGARQVGKTWLIREMLQRNDIHFFEVNLQERDDILAQLKSVSNAAELSSLLALYSNVPLEERKSVIFLDEIQLYPDILSKIKFLVDEGKFRYILSGSNLGVELKGLHSMPVGYVEQWQMFPMNIFEFAIAMGAKAETIDYLKTCFTEHKPVDPLIHQQMIRAFYYYLMTGGMPAVVSTFIEKQNMAAVDAEQKNILNQYKADFIKYEAENRRLRIISVFDTIPSQLNKQNRRFTFTELNKELRFERYEESFLWLKDAAVAIPVYNTQEPRMPLEQSRSSNLFRLFQSDVGLLTACYPARLRQEILQMNPDAEINFGSLFENYVACELYASELKVYYYKTAKIGEIDFITELEGNVLPIEVKSGKDYKRHKSLDNLMSHPAYNIPRSVVFSLNNLENSDKILYCPIYMTPFFRPDQPDDQKINVKLFE